MKDLDEQVAYARSFEAVLWAMPASAIYRFRVGLLELPGVFFATSDLRKGPTVLEVPAKTEKGVMYGQVVDAWQATIADVGPTGPDKGAGGKYLFLPPGDKGEVPEGYFAIRSTTNRILFRKIPQGIAGTEPRVSQLRPHGGECRAELRPGKAPVNQLHPKQLEGVPSPRPPGGDQIMRGRQVLIDAEWLEAMRLKTLLHLQPNRLVYQILKGLVIVHRRRRHRPGQLRLLLFL